MTRFTPLESDILDALAFDPAALTRPSPQLDQHRRADQDAFPAPAARPLDASGAPQPAPTLGLQSLVDGMFGTIIPAAPGSTRADVPPDKADQDLTSGRRLDRHRRRRGSCHRDLPPAVDLQPRLRDHAGPFRAPAEGPCRPSPARPAGWASMSIDRPSGEALEVPSD